MTNEKRAHAARAGLVAFLKDKGDLRSGERLERMHPTDLADAVSDLICDLGHACAALGVDYAEALDRAGRNYAHESAPDYQGD